MRKKDKNTKTNEFSLKKKTKEYCIQFTASTMGRRDSLHKYTKFEAHIFFHKFKKTFSN